MHHGWSGFGIYQVSGVIVGIACCIAGLTLRVAPAVVLGSIIFVAATLADLLGLHGSPGFGLKQQVLLFIGAGLLCVGVIRSLARFKSIRPNVRPEMAG